jgi:hypothetical protein
VHHEGVPGTIEGWLDRVDCWEPRVVGPASDIEITAGAEPDRSRLSAVPVDLQVRGENHRVIGPERDPLAGVGLAAAEGERGEQLPRGAQLGVQELVVLRAGQVQVAGAVGRDVEDEGKFWKTGTG